MVVDRHSGDAHCRSQVFCHMIVSYPDALALCTLQASLKCCSTTRLLPDYSSGRESSCWRYGYLLLGQSSCLAHGRILAVGGGYRCRDKQHVIGRTSPHSQAQGTREVRITNRSKIRSQVYSCKLRGLTDVKLSDRDKARSEASPSYSCQEIQILKSAPSSKSGQGRFKRCRRSQRIQFDLV
jgi:hypothetical protein